MSPKEKSTDDILIHARGTVGGGGEGTQHDNSTNFGTASHGTARHGTPHHEQAPAGHGTARTPSGNDMAWHGMAQNGTADCDVAWHDTALHGTGSGEA